MRSLTKKVEIYEKNFPLIEVESLVIYNSQRYHVYDIQGGSGLAWRFQLHLEREI